MSKWKKIGSVHSGEGNKTNRSVRSRSRDDMPTLSFRENVTKMKLNTSDVIDSENTYFCKNYIDKKKQTSSNRSHSKIRTERSIGNFDVMRSTISKRRLSKDYDNESHYSGTDRIEKQQPKKLKQFAKQSQIKALKQDHLRLKEYVKFEINSFKSAFKDLEAELRFQINYKKQAIAQKSKSQQKTSTLTPIVPFRFDCKILENINFTDTGSKKVTGKGQHADINVLNQIKTEARLCIDSLNEFEAEKQLILEKFKDINLEQLLA